MFETTSTGALVQRPSGDVSLSIGDTTNSNGHLVLTAKSSSIELHGRSNHPINILFNTVQKASIGIDGTISDNIGNVRQLGQVSATSSFTIASDHAGKFIRQTTSGRTMTVPADVFSVGTMITIVNRSSGTQTIAQGTSVTMYNSADGATGNRTLAANGMCTLLFTASNEVYISGAGLS